MNFTILIPILIFLGAFALVFGIRYLQNKERMAMIERGMDLRSNLPKQRQKNLTLTFGLLLIGSGLGLFIAYMLDIFVLVHYRSFNPGVYFSLIAIFGGIGLLVSYFIENKANQKKEL